MSSILSRLSEEEKMANLRDMMAEKRFDHFKDLKPMALHVFKMVGEILNHSGIKPSEAETLYPLEIRIRARILEAYV